MTDFDHLIKNKANRAHYPYKASAWHNFLHKAGIKAGPTLGQTITVTITSLLILGGVFWGIFRHQKSPSPVEPTMPCRQTDTSMAEPVAEMITVGDTSTVEMPVTEINQITPPSVSPASSNNTTSASTSESQTAPKVNKERRERLGRPVRINPDTIKDNVPTDEQLRQGHSRIISQ